MSTVIGDSVMIQVTTGVATVTLNRPEVANAIDSQTRSDLIEIFSNIQASEDIRAVILTGDSENFCGGSDVSSLQDVTTSESSLRLKVMRQAPASAWHSCATGL
ncbi:MAG: enoyl-CoA hydratase/isomerase family protein [Gammaproteobacteria bacterium]